MKIEALTLLFRVVLVAIIVYFLPLITRPGIFFSATVDRDFPHSPDGRRLLRRYRAQVVLWSVAALLATAFAVARHSLLGGLLPTFALLAAISFVYWRSFREVHARYGVSRPELRRASLAPEEHPEGFRLVVLLPPFLALGLTAWYLQTHWSVIPERLPTHWGADGQPNRWGTRDVHSIFGPLLAGVLLNLFVLGLGWLLSRLSRNTVMRYVTVRSLEVMTYPLTLTFVVVGLLPLMQPASREPIVLLTVIPTMLTVAAVIYWSYRKISVPAPESDLSPEPQADVYWKAGMFYYNPGDPAIFVAKRVGIGYTMNFANKLSWLMVAGLLLLALLPALVLRAK